MRVLAKACLKYGLALFGALAVAYGQPSGKQSNPCAEILRGGVFEVHRYQADSKYKQAVDDLVYSLDIRTSQQAQSAGLDISVVYEGIPIDFGGTYDSNAVDNWRKEYLTRRKSEVTRQVAIANFKQVASPEIAKAWTRCVELYLAKPMGLRVDIRSTNPTSPKSKYVSVFISYENSTVSAECKIKSIQFPGLKKIAKVPVLVPGAKLGPQPISEIFEATSEDVAVQVATDIAGGTIRTLNMKQREADQISALIKAQQTAGYIPGEIRAFAGTKLPAGWMECNGRSVNTIDFKALFKAIGSAWGTQAPVGPGGGDPPIFNIPDLRGQFLRGWDHGAKQDPDASTRIGKPNGSGGDQIGSFQSSAVGNHVHPLGRRSDLWHLEKGEQTANGNYYIPSTGHFNNGQETNLFIWQGSNSENPIGGSTESRPSNAYVIFAIYTGVPTHKDL